MESKREIALFLGPCKQKYPKSVYFFELSAMANCHLGQYETALYDANTGLELDSNCHVLLYYKAFISKSTRIILWNGELLFCARKAPRYYI
jgi:hypothetical protein